MSQIFPEQWLPGEQAGRCWINVGLDAASLWISRRSFACQTPSSLTSGLNSCYAGWGQLCQRNVLVAMEKGKALTRVCETEIIHRPSAEVALIHIQTEQEGMLLLCQNWSVSEYFQNVVMAGPYWRVNEKLLQI